MGILNLLLTLNKIGKRKNISDFKFKKIAIDGYGW
jgi:hypothetical protein